MVLGSIYYIPERRDLKYQGPSLKTTRSRRTLWTFLVNHLVQCMYSRDQKATSIEAFRIH